MERRTILTQVDAGLAIIVIARDGAKGGVPMGARFRAPASSKQP